ncbi:MAG: folate family ECF transporter S component [Oscillibacter sp.]|jgi:ECF transporter S component (folate family)|nr:folate family ECF transporter S component [Oscillibacter sp.]
MSKSKTRAICRTAVLAALYAVLTLVSIRAGNLRITFASLPVVVCALLYSPWEAATVALLGEFLNQMLSYGFTATTVLWLIPPALRGLLIGLAALHARRAGRQLAERPAIFYTVCMGAALATTAVNTLVIWFDSVIYHYFTFAYVFGDAMLRFLTGIVTAAVVATVALPLTRLLRRCVPAAGCGSGN